MGKTNTAEPPKRGQNTIGELRATDKPCFILQIGAGGIVSLERQHAANVLHANNSSSTQDKRRPLIRAIRNNSYCKLDWVS